MIYITILFFIISPILSIPLILLGIGITKEKRLLMLLLLAMIFAILSYYFEPFEDYDLFRYFKVMKDIEYNMLSIMDVIKVVDYEALFCIALYIISIIGNYRLLSCIFTFLVYFIIFYIIDGYSKKINLSNLKTFILVVLLVSTFNYINFASGLRNGMGFVISILAIYLEYVEEKKSFIYKILYIIPYLIHKSLFIIIIFRLILIFDYKKVKKIYIPLMIGIFLSGNLIINLSNLFSYLPFLSSLGERAISYAGDQEFGSFSLISIFLIMVALFNAIICLYNKKNNKEYINEKLYDFISMILILCIAVIPYRVIFVRYLTFYNLISFFTIADFLKNEHNKNNYTCIIMGLSMIICVGTLFQYTNIKSSNFGNLFSEGIIKNIFSIFYIG